MSTYSIEKLQSKLDKNLAARKRELTIIKTQVTSAENLILNTFIRIGIVMLYAHWEGFIKIAAREYLCYLNHLHISRNTMKDNFHTLAIKPTIRDCSQSLKTEKYYEILNEVINNSSMIFNVNQMDKLIVNTESNLSYSVLQDILFNLGLEKNKYELKANYIKEELLDKRNAIAHGELLEMTTEESIEDRKQSFYSLCTDIIKLMETFKEQILDAATQQLYLKEVSNNLVDDEVTRHEV